MISFRKLKKANNVLVIRRVAGHSMEPVLKEGQIVIATNLLRPRKGRVVIANVGSKEIIKRIVGTNGKNLNIAGDNYHDSMNFGPLERSQIIATMLFKI